MIRWKQAGCEALKSRPYDLADIAAWRQDRARNQTMGQPSWATPMAEGAHDDRARKLKADADKAEIDARLKALQLQILQQDWLSRDVVEQQREEAFAAIRAALLLIPQSASRETIASSKLAEHEAILERQIDDALEHLASDRFWAVLEQRKRRAMTGASVGRRGRPKGS